ncbi:septum formation protein Maf [Candidatus Bathyarchaeota archaeon]|nr:septum formation protein Maf [Candidatus Bathyarchaeota archaeon]
MNKNISILLASTSPRRVSLLDQIGMNYTQVGPSYEEDSSHPNPRKRVMENSLKKALSVKGESGLIISADTLVFVSGEVLGKPEDKKEAKVMLRKLSGNVHAVFTGVTLLDQGTGKMMTRSEKTLVHIKNLSEEEVESYVINGEPMGKAGAYAIQGLGAALVDRVVGCFHNVMGLPLSLLWDMLKEFGIDPFDLIE